MWPFKRQEPKQEYMTVEQQWPRDLAAIVGIERLQRSRPRGQRDVEKFVARGGLIVVSQCEEGLSGYLFAKWGKRGWRIVRWGVRPGQSVRSTVRHLSRLLERSMPAGSRSCVIISERKTREHLLWKGAGFKAVGVLREYGKDGSDYYVFVREKPAERASSCQS